MDTLKLLPDRRGPSAVERTFEERLRGSDQVAPENADSIPVDPDERVDSSDKQLEASSCRYRLDWRTMFGCMYQDEDTHRYECTDGNDLARPRGSGMRERQGFQACGINLNFVMLAKPKGSMNKD